MTCWPGDLPATLPHNVEADENHPSSLRAEYRCEWEHEWVTWWNAEAAGWPLDRRSAA